MMSPKRIPAARAERSAENSWDRFRRWQKPLVLAGLLVAAVLLVYWQAGGFDFILLDDPVYVSENVHVQRGITLQNFRWSFAEFHDANWIPLTWLSLMLDAQISGPGPRGFHLTNVLLHAANACVLFAVLARATHQLSRSALVAGLFALHPLHVESVAWVAERKDVLSTLFGLLSLLAYVNYANAGRARSLVASFLWFVCSLLSKPTLVTLPFVFLLLDFWPLGRLSVKGISEPPAETPALESGELEPEPRAAGDAAAPAGKSRLPSLIGEKVPFFAVTGVISIVVLLAQSRGHAVAPLASLSLTTRCMNAVTAYATYLWQAVFPLNLAIYYPHPGDNIAWGTVAFSAALLLAISLIVVVRGRRYPFLLVGWAWYLGTLVPMIGIVQVGRQQMADRYTYFPLIGVFVAAVWLIAELVPAGALRARVLPAAAIASVVALGAAAFVQVGYWRDSVTLFRHAVESAGNNPMATSALGYALMSRGQASEGLALLETAVRTAPTDEQSQYNVAVGLQSVGRLDQAAEHYRAALALDERDAEAHTNLGVLLCERHHYPEAKEHFLRAVAINPEHVKAYVNLGTLCVETREYEDAIKFSQHALELDPHVLNCRQNIGLALRAQGRLDQAIEQFQYLLKLAPNDADAIRELQRTLAMKRGS
jgi:tetratricopeptide (TPR) repeat protein